MRRSGRPGVANRPDATRCLAAPRQTWGAWREGEGGAEDSRNRARTATRPSFNSWYLSAGESHPELGGNVAPCSRLRVRRESRLPHASPRGEGGVKNVCCDCRFAVPPHASLRGQGSLVVVPPTRVPLRATRAPGAAAPMISPSLIPVCRCVRRDLLMFAAQCGTWGGRAPGCCGRADL